MLNTARPPATGRALYDFGSPGARGAGGLCAEREEHDGGWWGEGDEIVSIDASTPFKAPARRIISANPTACARAVPLFRGHSAGRAYTTAYRWHVPDPVAFRKSLRFQIEHGNGSPPFRSGNYYYSVAYWYQTEPHAPFPKLPGPQQRVTWAGK